MIEELAKKKSEHLNFDQSAAVYHRHASVQQEVAKRLLASLDPWKEILPSGPIVELGCGTGFLSAGLQQLFPERELILSDPSPRMLAACRQNVEPNEKTRFKEWTAENIPVDEPTYAMTISSFATQWFRHPGYTLGQWLKVTQPSGLLLAAFPGNESFPEWKKYAEELGLPYTANTLPDTEEMVLKLSSDITQVDYYEDTITQKFNDAADFFRHLKNIGADTQLKGRHLSQKEMRLLINHWNDHTRGKIKVSWHVVFLAVKKNITA